MTILEAIGHVRATLRRRRKLALGVFLLLALPAALVVLATPSRFAARTTLLAKFGREYVYRGDSAANMLVPNFAQDDIITSVTDVMKSESLAEQVVAEVGPEVLYPAAAAEPPEGLTPLQAATAQFQRALRIVPGRRSTVLVVEYAHVDAALAASTLNRFVSDFQGKYLSLYGENRVEALAREAGSSKAELVEAKQELTAYERAHGTFAKDGQLEALVQRKVELETTKARLQSCCASTPGLADMDLQIASLASRIVTINDNQAEISGLASRLAVAQEGYDGVLKRLQEAKASRAMDESRMTSVQVVDPANVPTQHERPGRGLKLALALLFSALVGTFAALAAEAARRRYGDARDLRRAFPFPVLADVPLSKTREA